MTRRVRVLQVNSSFNNEAPAQGAAALARYLNPENFMVTAVSLRGQSESDSTTVQDLKRSEIPHRSLGMMGFFDVRVVPRLIRLMWAYRPDIVHTHAFRADFWVGIAANLAKVPILVSSIRGNEWDLFRADYPFVVSEVAVVASRLATSRADLLIAVSEGVRDHLLSVQGISPTRVRVIRNGADLERLAQPRHHPSIIRKELNVPPDAVLVGALAVLKPRKGLSYLIEAARAVVSRSPDVHFLLAGDGPERGQIERQIDRLGLGGRVRVLGFRSDPVALLDALDIYVLPSLFEGFPRSILEAMALGKPVVATDIGGSREAVGHGVSGLIVPPKDSQALAEAIHRLVGAPLLRKSMGEAGRRMVDERFNARVNAEAHEAVYRELLHAKGCA
jgi:glycosyltransferase involved in cell wall biosynthesis